MHDVFRLGDSSEWNPRHQAVVGGPHGSRQDDGAVNGRRDPLTFLEDCPQCGVEKFERLTAVPGSR